MIPTFQLSVAICTRNRHTDLWKCIVSISKQQRTENDRVEIIIVDDGEIDWEWLQNAQQLLRHKGMELRYYRKESSEAGLIKSRITSIELSNYENLLFLDDDVELYSDYFLTLKKTLVNYPNAVGVSGADQGFVCTLKGRITMLLSGRSRISPGKLSWSGFASAMNTWNKHKKVFKTEFLHGCNMFYRKKYLSEIQDVEWLQGYSLGEDLYISSLAGNHGSMYVNPDLKLWHHGSPSSRDKAEFVSYTKIINHFHLLQTRNKVNKFRYLMLRWTACFMSLEAKLQRNDEAYSGYRKGTKELRNLFAASRI